MSDLEGLAEEISSSGIETVFGVPGSGPSLTLIDHLSRRGVSFQTTHMEASAAIMAGVRGRMTGRAGVSVSIKGPGLANMLPGLAACRFEGFPLVAISEAYPPNTGPDKAHKRMNHAQLAAAVSKGHNFLPADTPCFSKMAAFAEAEAPGPVLLDIANVGAEGEEAPETRPSTHKGDVPRLIRRSRNPVVIAGTLAIRQGWSAALNVLSVPVFSTAAAKGIVDETMPHAAGVYTGVGLSRVPEGEVLAAADLVVGLGLRSSEVLASGNLPVTSVNIDPLGASASPGFEFAATADGNAFDESMALLADKNWGQDIVQHLIKRLLDEFSHGPFLPASCFRALERHFAGRARIVADTGYFCTMAEHAAQARGPDLYLGSGQGRYMGIGLPMAIGVAIGDPSTPTVLTIGDGGIGMFFAELRIAVERKLPVLAILMSDGGFGSVRTRAISDGLTQSPMLQLGQSWIGAAAGMNIPATRVETLADFETALAAWRPGDGVAFIEAGFDPEAYQNMVVGIRA